jgi:Amidohydrolase
MNTAAMRCALACGLSILAAAHAGAAGVAPHSFTLDDFASVEKVDAHVHINSSDSALIDQAALDHFRLLTINVDYPDFPPLAEQLRIAQAHAASYPTLVAYAASFSVQGWDEPGWQQRVMQQLDAAFTAGAVAVKVWKNIGMDFRDANGRLVMIDDPKFDPLFDFIRERHRVLIGHQGEPRNCWLAIADMSVNNDKEYFRDHPQYHMFLHPELPSYEQQIAARDQMLARNPQLKFMGAHLASLEWSVDKLAAFLDRYPNTVVDLAARIGQVQFQSNRDRGKVRRFFIRYQDRLLYGSDLTQEQGGDPAELRREAHATWLRDWRYLNTGQKFRVPELDAPVRGLSLPESVVRKIYSANAERWFGNPWNHSGSRPPGDETQESK